jgi:hypothetical protein
MNYKRFFRPGKGNYHEYKMCSKHNKLLYQGTRKRCPYDRLDIAALVRKQFEGSGFLVPGKFLCYVLFNGLSSTHIAIVPSSCRDV